MTRRIPENMTQLARKAKSASPWGRHPHCDTPAAKLSSINFHRRKARKKSQ